MIILLEKKSEDIFSVLILANKIQIQVLDGQDLLQNMTFPTMLSLNFLEVEDVS